MLRKTVAAALLFLAIAIGLPRSASATPIALGVLTFDTLIPGPDGTNAFFLTNLTGDPATGGFALPPDFPVVTSLTFDSPLLSWTGAPGSPFDFGHAGIGPGSHDPEPAIQFPDTTALLSATFTARLSTELLQLADGQLFQALSPTITASLSALGIAASVIDLDAEALTPGDSVVLTVDATEVPAAPAVPEPASLTLVATGLAASGFLRTRFKKDPTPDRPSQHCSQV